MADDRPLAGPPVRPSARLRYPGAGRIRSLPLEAQLSPADAGQGGAPRGIRSREWLDAYRRREHECSSSVHDLYYLNEGGGKVAAGMGGLGSGKLSEQELAGDPITPPEQLQEARRRVEAAQKQVEEARQQLEEAERAKQRATAKSESAAPRPVIRSHWDLISRAPRFFLGAIMALAAGVTFAANAAVIASADSLRDHPLNLAFALASLP